MSMINGFDYRTQSPCAMTRKAWREEFATNEAHGGHQKMIAGDRTAFDANGRMQFECYEKGGAQ